MEYVYDDGGRKAAGFPKMHRWGDCTIRACAIAMQKPYREVWDALTTGTMILPLWRQYLEDNGWKWHPTMGIGTGCTVHLCEDELPQGRLVVDVSRHLVTIIDGVIHDTYDPSRNDKRCVYGYWNIPEATGKTTVDVMSIYGSHGKRAT